MHERCGSRSCLSEEQQYISNSQCPFAANLWYSRPHGWAGAFLASFIITTNAWYKSGTNCSNKGIRQKQVCLTLTACQMERF